MLLVGVDLLLHRLSLVSRSLDGPLKFADCSSQFFVLGDVEIGAGCSGVGVLGGLLEDPDLLFLAASVRREI